jgi:hypothetical protein
VGQYYLRFHHLGHYYLRIRHWDNIIEPDDYSGTHVDRTLSFIPGVRLQKDLNEGVCTTDHWKSRRKGLAVRPNSYVFVGMC